MAGKGRAIPTAPVTVIVVAVVMAVAVTGVAVVKASLLTTSYLTTWSAAGCSGVTLIFPSLGCTDLVVPYTGLEFYYRGQEATLYTETGCSGTPFQLFEDIQTCGDIRWRSIYIGS